MRQLISGRHCWPFCTTSDERPLLEPRHLWLWQRLQMKTCWLHCWMFCIQTQWTIWECTWHLSLKELWRTNSPIDRGNSTPNLIQINIYFSYIKVFMLIYYVSFAFNDMTDLQYLKETLITVISRGFCFFCYRYRDLWKKVLKKDGRHLPSHYSFLVGRSLYIDLSRYFK